MLHALYRPCLQKSTEAFIALPPLASPVLTSPAYLLSALLSPALSPQDIALVHLVICVPGCFRDISGELTRTFGEHFRCFYVSQLLYVPLHRVERKRIRIVLEWRQDALRGLNSP